MNKNKLTEIFNEVLKRLNEAESECIQNYNCGHEDEYDEDDLNKDIQEYKQLFESTLNDGKS